VAPTPAFQAALADPAVRDNPADQGVLAAISNGQVGGGFSLDDSSFLSRIDGRLALPFLQGFSASMSLTLLVGAVLLVAALALVIFLPEVPLRQESGIEAQRSAAAASAVAAPGAANAGAATGPSGAAAAVAVTPAMVVDQRLRDHLLANLVNDLDGTLATLRVAERARDDARRARTELNEHNKALFDARQDLTRHGLTANQIDQLLELSPAEASRYA
jgi:hypothetical protein